MPDGTAPAVAIIPARGGSKRIPRKNIRPFLGVPLIARTISILRDSGVFDRVVVSTDDDEIAEIAVRAGAEAPFRRPAELSSDTATTLPVIADAIQRLEASGWRGAYACCAYPAAVLSVPQDYQAARKLLAGGLVNYVFTAASFPSSIQRALRRTADGGAEMFWPEHRDARSQDLEPAYQDAGQFYFGTRDAWLDARPIFSAASRMLELPRHRVQDIDTEEDWRRAELLFQLLQKDGTAR